MHMVALMWLSPFVGPLIAYVLLSTLRVFSSTVLGDFNGVQFLVAAILNLVFALPVLTGLRLMRCRSWWLHVGAAGAAVAFPALVLCSSPFLPSEEDLAHGTYWLPFSILVVFGALAGATFSAAARSRRDELEQA
jgi:hypothetical protein